MTSDGQVLWYRTRSGRKEFQDLVAALGEAGISLVHPALGCAVLLNVDGDQVRMSPDEVVNLVGFALGGLNIQFWYSADVDITCFISYEPLGWEKHTYYLDGLDTEETDRFLGVIYRLVSRRPNETIALVVDRSGRTADLEWDEMVNDARFESGERPDVLVLNKTMLNGLPDSDAAATSGGLGPDLKVVVGNVPFGRA